MDRMRRLKTKAPGIDVDFTKGSLPPNWYFSRLGAGTVEKQGYVEYAPTNLVKNSRGSGGGVGVAIPRWGNTQTGFGNTWGTHSVIGYTLNADGDYEVQIRSQGTNNSGSTQYPSVIWNNSGDCPYATIGMHLHARVDVRLDAGDPTGYDFIVQGMTSAYGYVETSGASVSLSGLTPGVWTTLDRPALVGSATVQQARMMVQKTVPNGTSFDCTFTFRRPQFSYGISIPQYIPTNGSEFYYGPRFGDYLKREVTGAELSTAVVLTSASQFPGTSNSSTALVGSEIEITSTAAANFGAWFTISNLTVGQKYMVTAKVRRGTAANCDFSVEQASGSLKIGSATTTNTTSTTLTLFPTVAVSGNTNFLVSASGAAVGLTIYVESVTVTALTPEYAPAGLFLETQSTNLLLNSAYVGTGTPSLTSATIARNSGQDWGFCKAFTVTNTTASSDWSGVNYMMLNNSWTAGLTYSWQVWYKAGTSGKCTIRLRDNTAATESICQGVVGRLVNTHSNSGVMTILEQRVLPNGVHHISGTFVPSVSSTDVYLRVGPFSLVANDTMHVLGAQFEDSAFPSSMIPTYGVSTTRPSDQCRLDNNVRLDGTWNFEFVTGAYGAQPHRVTVNSFDSVNRLTVQKGTDTARSAFVLGATGAAPNPTVGAGNANPRSVMKSAFRCIDNNFIGCFNGSLTVKYESIMPNTPGYLHLGDGAYLQTNCFYSKVKYFPVGYSDKELQSLTS